MPNIRLATLLALTLTAAGLAACNGGSGRDELVIYSGRNENLVRPLLDRFARESGFDVRVRYGDTTGMLGTLLEEGAGTRADVFLSQDAGALADLARRNMLAPLARQALDVVEPRFKDPGGKWVGVTGRVRVIAYNTRSVSADDLPAGLLDVVDPRWRGRVGFPPSNASFIAMVSALREQRGEAVARRFLEGLKANDAKRYDNNVLVLKAVADGEVDLGLVNHYYLYNEFKERSDSPVANHFPGQQPGGEGTFVNVSGAAILARSDAKESAARFVSFLLGEEAQRYFRDETAEYPLRKGVDPIPELPALSSLRTIDVPLERLGGDVEATVALIRELGLS